MPVFRGLGINIVYLGDFHDDSDGTDAGPKRLPEQKAYFEASAKLSDKDFLVMPEEEANAFIDGHTYIMTPEPIYFTHPRQLAPGTPFEENVPGYGTVYHLGSTDDVLRFMNETKSIIWVAHPRTKSSAMYPDMYKDKDYFQSDRFIGGSWESLPVDLSQPRLCEVRCFGVNDDMSNWAPKPKFMLAEGDTYMKAPGDDTYSSFAVNYLKLDKVPAVQRELGADCGGHPRWELLRDDGRDPVPQLGDRRRGREERLHGDDRVHLPAGVRGAGVERRGEGRPQDHSADGYDGVRDEELPDTVRRDGEEVGAASRCGTRRGMVRGCSRWW